MKRKFSGTGNSLRKKGKFRNYYNLAVTAGSAAAYAGQALYKKWKAQGKPKRAMSKTTTKTRPTTSKMIVAKSGQSQSYTNISYKKHKHSSVMNYLTQPTLYKRIGTVALTSTVSKQGVMNLWSCNITGKASIGSYEGINIENFYAALQVKPDGTQEAGFPVLSTTTSTNLKMYIQNCNIKVDLTNCSQLDGIIEIYDCMSKQSADDLNGPTQDWFDGIADEVAPGFGAASSATVGYTPTQVKQFNIKWKVVKRTKVYMAGGQTHLHTFNFNVNRMVDMAYLNQVVVIKGITYASFVVFRGQPVTDGTTNNIAHGPMKIAAIINSSMTGRMINAVAKKIITVDFQETLTKQQFMDQDGGGIADALAATIADGGGAS